MQLAGGSMTSVGAGCSQSGFSGSPPPWYASVSSQAAGVISEVDLQRYEDEVQCRVSKGNKASNEERGEHELEPKRT